MLCAMHFLPVISELKKLSNILSSIHYKMQHDPSLSFEQF
jgi:hypothetical protein